jgi:mannuronan 5-epimerase
MVIVLVLTVSISNPFVYSLSIQQASAIKRMTSLSIEDGVIPSSSTSSSASPQSKTTTTAADCINYDSSTETITVSCNSARLSDVYNQLHDNRILAKQSQDGTWFLSANLVIAKGAIFHIDSTDTKWLRISSSAGTINSPNNLPFGITVYGSLKVDSVKITSWNPATNDYSITSGTPEHPGSPRPSILVERGATGTTDITNSEIAYLGYGGVALGSPNRPPGLDGISYVSGGGKGSILKGNNIHDNWFGFYSSGVGGIVIAHNDIHNNYIYGIDPHTGTHGMVIRDNVVHDNGAIGIICSLNCDNITIENNNVYNHNQSGIMFSRNMSNSVARNNTINNEVKCIFVSESNNNRVYDNLISNCHDGIDLKNGSSGNIIYNNNVINSTTNGLSVNTYASNNTFYSNILKDSKQYGISAEDPTTVNNTFSNNQLINSHYVLNSHNKINGTKSVNIR